MHLPRITLIFLIFSLLLFSCNNERPELARLAGQVMQKNNSIIEEGNHNFRRQLQESYFDNPAKVRPSALKLIAIALHADSIHGLAETALLNGAIGNAKKQELLNTVLDFQKLVHTECFSERDRDQARFDTLNKEIFDLPDNLFIDAIKVHISQIKSIGFRTILSYISASCFKFDIVEAQIIPESRQVKLNSVANFHVFLTTSRRFYGNVTVLADMYKNGILLASDTVSPNINEVSYGSLNFKYNYTALDTGNYLLKTNLLLHYFDETEVYATEEVKFLVK